ncbi:MAG: bifunctional proline dehydrogenase/L-glutamate gamma-semialdehyde dehydrogenase PutA [Alphaproteobacteria bacterium]|nr:bifunctional proline dehydrogenase/L-glutamate gamma-semialdehyde dehydrogenase PutA [Alphaproteobacteria bacterium]
MDFVYPSSLPPAPSMRAAIRSSCRIDETMAVCRILAAVELTPDMQDRIADRARLLVTGVRRERIGKGGIDAFLHEYALSSPEGVALLCLAEALLRVPDAETVDRLIRDKIGEANWESHLGRSGSIFVNASTWALMLTGRLLHADPAEHEWRGALRRFVARSGEPVVRQAVTAAMRILGRQFVMGRTIEEALEVAREWERRGYRHSYDMLGEAARTAAAAADYFAAYDRAIAAIGRSAKHADIAEAPGISVKLSALDPRYEMAQRDRVLGRLSPLLLDLARHAKQVGVGLTIDAEEADRLELSLDLFEALASAPDLAGWDGLGLAVQAYQKRALLLIDWLAELARRGGRRLMIRLVKGAYWDSEIKRAQERGLDGYPVYTRKVATDVSYLACAHRLLSYGSAFYPQFATHNAHTLSAVIEMAGGRRDYEFQRLHGMGEALYEQIVGPDKVERPCRVYAPVGSHEDLLPYLVRRLLENGANTSFVNRIIDDKQPIDQIIVDPVARLAQLQVKPHPRIPLPRDIYQPERKNSRGLDLDDPDTLAALSKALADAQRPRWTAAPIIGGVEQTGAAEPVFDPSDRRRQVGEAIAAGPADIDRALARAVRSTASWDHRPAGVRAAILERAADLYEDHRTELMALVIREGGRTIPAALAELREAVDYLRYYAARARIDFARPMGLPGPAGERNAIELRGRGVFACISPWNFPLAIFTGQVAAALAAGNAVVAKPAEQTPLTAAAAVRLLLEAGVPGDVLHLLPGTGKAVGAPLVADRRIAGVAFTGSTETARGINLELARRAGPIVPFIAETGGQNAMIVDSSALAEQVVADVLTSAFDSAGQRCSATRLLYIQADVADHLLAMLAGAMAELVIGDPAMIATDVGPVIDGAARGALERHAARMAREGQLIWRCPPPAESEHGTFFPPQAWEIDSASRLAGEVFGPILHVVRWQADRLDAVLDEIAATGYGLTLGIHSRIDATVRKILGRLRVGNSYVNRSMIGAVVGVQPFGGEGLSGTGPKAGGPRYLQRFATERTVSVDTTAAGGNATLLSLQEETEAAVS